jgi:hypothetical protein
MAVLVALSLTTLAVHSSMETLNRILVTAKKLRMAQSSGTSARWAAALPRADLTLELSSCSPKLSLMTYWKQKFLIRQASKLLVSLLPARLCSWILLPCPLVGLLLGVQLLVVQ